MSARVPGSSGASGSSGPKPQPPCGRGRSSLPPLSELIERLSASAWTDLIVATAA